MNYELLSTKIKTEECADVVLFEQKKTSTWLVFFEKAVGLTALEVFSRNQADIFLLKSSTLGVAMKIEL